MYLERYAKREQKPRTLVETTRALRVHLAPLHRGPLAEITRRDVAARLKALVDCTGRSWRTGPGGAVALLRLGQSRS